MGLEVVAVVAAVGKVVMEGIEVKEERELQQRKNTM